MRQYSQSNLFETRLNEPIQSQTKGQEPKMRIKRALA